MDRLSRLTVLASLLAALGVEVWIVAGGWSPFTWLTATAFVAAFVGARWVPGVTLPAIVGATYLVPLFFRIHLGIFTQPHLASWSAAVLGLILGRRALRPWSLPPVWKWPLALWALTLAVSWPLVVAREGDFATALFVSPRVANTGVGVPPAFAALGIVDVVVIQLLGITWFDWLYERFRDQGSRLRSQVLLPLGVSAVLACLFGVYQGLVDISFLSGGSWAFDGRAAGPLLDANAFGVVAALWGLGFLALASSTGGVRPWPMTATIGTGLALSWFTVWSTGSRTALLAAAVGFCLVAVETFRGVSRSARRQVGVAVAALALVLILIAIARPLTSVGPLRRLYSGIPAQGVEATVVELWNRRGYGTAAVRMIREHPLVGVGVGTFNLLVSDYSAEQGRRIPFDNAQNWFRHQLAELGVLGSPGWMLWVALFTTALLRTRGDGVSRLPATSIKGALVGFAAASLLGMPSQNNATSFTFWTFAFWYLALVPPDADRLAPAWLRRRWRPRPAWVAIVTLVAIHAASTYAVARADLRPAHRAMRFGWNYQYGFFDPEAGPDGQSFRWTAREAVAVVPARGRVLKFDGWIVHPDADVRPVQVHVWVGSTLVIATRLRGATPLPFVVPLPGDAPRDVVRIWVDRTWPLPDGRDVGLAVSDWRYQDAGMD